MKLTNYYIGYLLSRLLYTYKANREYVFVNNSIQIQELLHFLWKKGFISSYFICNNFRIKVYLKYFNGGMPLFSDFKVKSIPSKRVFFSINTLHFISNRKLVVISTHQGLLTPLECISKGIGGEFLFELI